MAEMAASTGRVPSFGRDVALMIAARVGGLVLASGQAIVIARTLGPGGRGQVAVALSLTLVLVQIGNLGVVSANPYFAAREPGVIPKLVTVSLWLSATLGLLVIGIGVLTRVALPSLVHGISVTQLSIALAVGPFSLASTFLQSIFLGEGRTFVYNIAELVLAAALFASLTVGLLAFDVGVDGVLALTGLRFAAGALFYLMVLVRRHGFLASLPDGRLIGQMLRYGARVYGASLLGFLVIRSDVLLVNAYLGVKQAGLYTAAVTAADALYVVPTAFALNLFPRVARGLDSEASARVFRAVAVVYGAMCLVSVPLAAPAVHLVYGPAFHRSVALFYWLLPGIFSLGMLNVLGYYFAGRGFPLQILYAWAIGLAVNVAINMAFLSSAGTYIASLSSSIAYGILFALLVRMFVREGSSYGSLIPGVGDVTDSLRMVSRLVRPARVS